MHLNLIVGQVWRRLMVVVMMIVMMVLVMVHWIVALMRHDALNVTLESVHLLFGYWSGESPAKKDGLPPEATSAAVSFDSRSFA